jgi:hypothetical protein
VHEALLAEFIGDLPGGPIRDGRRMTHNSAHVSVVNRLPSSTLPFAVGRWPPKHMDRFVLQPLIQPKFCASRSLKRSDPGLRLADDPLRIDCGFTS